jgi:glycosyltransferase involved in cell wall biosynthesis
MVPMNTPTAEYDYVTLNAAVSPTIVEADPGADIADRAPWDGPAPVPGARQGKPKRVLFIAYQFPPVGGAGVQRVVKFVKYLGEYGWEPSVLTVANPSVPAFDDSLLRDIPKQTIIARAKTWEPGYAVKKVVSQGRHGDGPRQGFARSFAKSVVRSLANLVLQPDPQVLWLPRALAAGKRLLREVAHDAIVATGPPFSSFIVGAALSRRSGLPLVLDYRDEWGISNAYWENKKPSRLGRRIQSRIEARVVRQARALVASTRSSAGALKSVRTGARSDALVSWIYNGFDPDDFEHQTQTSRQGDGRYRLAYVGTLWNLTSVGPLVEGIRELARRQPSLAARLELVCAGRRTTTQEQLLDQLKGLPCRVVTHPYLEHDAAIDLIQSADALCVLLADVPGGERVVPAKVFEYIAARRAILAVTPRGELSDLLQSYNLSHCVDPGNALEIAGWLARQIQQHASGSVSSPPRWNGSQFDRRHQAGQLAELLSLVSWNSDRSRH